MKRRHYPMFLLLSLLSVSLTPREAARPEVSDDLARLARLGITHQYLDKSTIELRDSASIRTCIKTLDEPQQAAIQEWAALRGIPVIDIDPTTVDTTRWTGWYDYWTYVLLGNDLRMPTQVGDFDGNGYPELYGNFGGIGFPQTRAYEVYTDGSSSLRYVYPSTTGYSTHIADIDRNGLMEVAFSYGPYTYFYEQPAPNALPTQLKCAFNKYNGLAPYVSNEHIADMDGDSAMDFVHRGADTSVAPGYMLAVSEYHPSIQNFERVWYTVPPLNLFDGYDVGDYDGDGRMEIAASSLWGAVWVIENIGDNGYSLTFQDSLPLVNLFYQTSGDVDRDGAREFFVGATMGSGNWTVMFEADSDNHYSPRIVLHLLSGGSLDDPTYFCRDINNDGALELVILSGGWLYVFKSDADDSYYLWYLRQGPSSVTVNFYDMNGDSIQDILWTSIREERWATDIFRGSPLVGVEPGPPPLPQRVALLQNYPNPFNPATRIRYVLPEREQVRLSVCDVAGRELAVLVDGVRESGTHEVFWNARNAASGVYFCQLCTRQATVTRKMAFVR